MVLQKDELADLAKTTARVKYGERSRWCTRHRANSYKYVSRAMSPSTERSVAPASKSESTGPALHISWVTPPGQTR